MIYAIMEQNGKEQLCCVDRAGRRAFPVNEFFDRDLREFRIDSNKIEKIPATMEEFIRNYDVLWADDMALFFGSSPELGVNLDPENGWVPLVRLEKTWSPLTEVRGLSLLEQ